jgi:Mn-dependent DtxR family transcriptional regulator
MDTVLTVDEDVIADVLSNWTGIPIVKLTQEESEKLLHMEDELHKRVIGQEQAISAVSQGDPPHARRPQGPQASRPAPSSSSAPPGVGKTELAKTLAEYLFGKEDALIHLDMSEYMEKHTVSRLIGSPPGYVGYDEGGQLTEQVRRKPFSVVLFDEVEKAHPDVFNTLLQILEDGRLTDAQGRTVDFKNTILIMTSNLGTKNLTSPAVGFVKATDDSMYEKMKRQVDDELKKHFRPEFLNRIDDTIVFHPLTMEEVTRIVDLMMKRVKSQMAVKGLDLELTDALKVWLSEKGYDPQLGARPLRRTIQRELEDKCSASACSPASSTRASSSSRTSAPMRPPSSSGPSRRRPRRTRRRSSSPVVVAGTSTSRRSPTRTEPVPGGGPDVGQGHDLIDSTEMYLRIVLELEEEGIPALRARVAERLHLSAPSVSEGVSRLEEQGLLVLTEDRTVALTDRGREWASSVMRKHRLAERLLADVIGLDPAFIHEEACRWEHVISDRVEERIAELLGNPTTSPYGNPIPGSGFDGPAATSLDAFEGGRAVVHSLSEQIQSEEETIASLFAAGIRAGATVDVEREGEGTVLRAHEGAVVLDAVHARLVFVVPA